jgi:hypothetical protein
LIQSDGAFQEFMAKIRMHTPSPSEDYYDPKPVMHDWLESKVRSLSKVRREVMGIGGGDDSDNEGDSDGGQ